MLADVQAAIERAGLSGLLLAGALKEHGLLRDDEERPAEAIPFYERALAIVRAKPAAGPVTAALLLANLASSHAECGDSDLALSLSAEALTLLQGGVESTNPAFAAALYAHGVALHSLARNTEALRDLREALEIWRHAPHPDSAQLALTNEAIAGCLSDFGYNNLAEASEREALAIRGTIGEPDSPAVGASLNNLGVILAREQKWSDGMQSLEKSAMIFEQLGETEQRRLTTALGNLGALYFNQPSRSTAASSRSKSGCSECRTFVCRPHWRCWGKSCTASTPTTRPDASTVAASRSSSRPSAHPIRKPRQPQSDSTPWRRR
jgi:tetratricopeptide (TPR) repeat protein